METAGDIVARDLEHICSAAGAELEALSGHDLLITGGAGFLGHYLVQAAAHWNRRGRNGIRVTVFDNFSRGVPGWLTALEAQRAVTLVRHDMTRPLPNGT